MPRFYQADQATDPELRNKLAMLQAQFGGQDPNSPLPMQGPAENDPALANDFKMMQDAGWFSNGNGTPAPVEPTQLGQGNGTVSTLNGWGEQAKKERNQLNALLTAKVMAGDLDGASQLAVTPEDRALVQIGYAQRMNRQAGGGGDLLKSYQDAQYTNQMRQRGEQDRQLKNEQLQATTRNINAQATNAEIKDPMAADWSMGAQGMYNKRTGETKSLAVPKSNEAFNNELAKLDAKELDDMRNAATKAQQGVQRVQQMKELVKGGIYSGSFAEGRVGVANFFDSVGMPFDQEKLANSQQYLKHAKELTLSLLKDGVGNNQISNADLAFVDKTVPQLETNPEARKKLLDFIEGKLQFSVDRFSKADEYARSNGGLNGFQYRPQAPASPTGPAPLIRPASTGNHPADIQALLSKYGK